MPIPGVFVSEGETLPAGSRTPGDVSTLFIVGTATRGASDKAIQINTGAEIQQYLGDPFGGSYLHRSLAGFFQEGGGQAYVARAVDSTAASASTVVKNSANGNVLTFTADGPGTWGNSLKRTVEDGVSGRKKITITENDVVRVSAEASSAEEAAMRLTLPGVVRVTTAGSAWPPVNSAATTFSGGAGNDTAVTEANVITALGLFGNDLGSGTVVAPGITTESMHEALLDHARDKGRFALCDLPDIDDTPTLVAQAAQARAYKTEKAGRYGQLLWPWTVVPLGDVLTANVPSSGLQAGRMARADETDPQRQARGAAGPAYTSDAAIAVTRKPTDANWGLLADAGVTVIRQEAEGVCAMDVLTIVDATRWPQYAFATGARVRQAIVDAARAAVRPYLFQALDGNGVRLEHIKGAVEGVCQPYAEEPISGLYDQDGDGGYSVAIVSTTAELVAGRVVIQLGLRTSPAARQIVIEFTAVAVGVGL